MMMMNTQIPVSAGILAISGLSKDLDQSGSSLIRPEQTMFKYDRPYHNLLLDEIDEKMASELLYFPTGEYIRIQPASTSTIFQNSLVQMYRR